MINKNKLCSLYSLTDKQPAHHLINGQDFVVIKYGTEISVLRGRCNHRGTLMADGYISGNNIICGLHGWDFRYDTGVCEYNNEESLNKFSIEIADGLIYIDEAEINAYLHEHPQPFIKKNYLGAYADTHPENTEPYTSYNKELSKNSLKKYGKHGFSASMGVDRNTLPKLEEIFTSPSGYVTFLHFPSESIIHFE